jgi:hydroxylysine kinase
LEDPAATGFQNAMLRHLDARGAPTPLPRLVLSLTGDEQLEVRLGTGSRHIVRLMTYLPGIPLSERTPSADLRRQVAQAAAHVDLALADFTSAGGDNAMLWNVARADRVRPLLPAVADRDLRRLADEVLARWESHVQGALKRRPEQFIHNDLNLHNIVVDADDRIAGVIDFGDAVKAPVIAELATAAAYQLFDLDDPVAALIAMAGDYHALRPLAEADLNLLFDLVATRWAITIGIAHSRARRHPTNGPYILRNAPRSAIALRVFACLSRDAVTDALKTACLG